MVSRTKLAVIVSICVVIVIASLVLYLHSFQRPTSPTIGSIKIGLAVPLTGLYSYEGSRMLQGHLMAVEDINAEGGVYVRELGKRLPITLIYYDCKSEETTTISVGEKMITVDKVNIVGVTHGYPLYCAVVPLADKYKIPILALGTTAIEGTPQANYSFILGFGSAPRQAQYLLELMNSLNPKPRRVAMITSEEAFMIGLRKVIHGMLAKVFPGTFELIFDETYPKGLSEFTPILSRIAPLKPDAFLAMCRAPEAYPLTRNMIEMNFKAPFIFIARGSNQVEYQKQFGVYAEGVINQACWVPEHPESYAPGITKFVEKHRARLGEPDIYSALGYGTIHAIAQAIEIAGSLDPARLRDTFAHLDVRSVSGHFKIGYDEWIKVGNVNIDGPYVVGQWQKGKIECVWPPEARTKNLVYPFRGWGVIHTP